MPSHKPNPRLSNPIIISLLGPPGSGKGTQSALLAQHHPNIKHISIGAMLREEMDRPTSPWASLLRENMLAGRLGPLEMTVSILKSQLNESAHKGEVGAFVLDGFPRAWKPAQLFEEQVAPIHRVLVLECPEETLIARLKTRARFDDMAGAENLSERMRTYREETAQVIEAFEAEGKVIRIDADRDVDATWQDVKAATASLLKDKEAASIEA